ncbi:hypothetical protein FA95DRAFT_66095 [Auriscalpium vulgare]|uniref:Uncharacterized protein n=1 Tax=Auriscalpium vulgare TaxID=40419 RepID=A0ACB8S7L9_9AGAM|nr:hypothetical protein FA95DRAFT_66095 [Auriscalpium vulgare]
MVVLRHTLPAGHIDSGQIIVPRCWRRSWRAYRPRARCLFSLLPTSSNGIPVLLLLDIQSDGISNMTTITSSLMLSGQRSLGVNSMQEGYCRSELAHAINIIWNSG